MNIQEKRDKVVKEITAATNSDDRFRTLIKLGRALTPLPEEGKDEKFLVEGCISKAWLYPRFEDGKVIFAADSEAAIVKGIIAALVNVYSGESPKAILALDAGFLVDAGVTEHLSMNRRNGLANITKQIKLYAAAYQAMAQISR